MKKRHIAFSLVEILIVIAIILILISILLPVLFAAKARAQSVNCASNLRQIGLALQIYTQDHDDMFPIGAYNTSGKMSASWDFTWQDALIPYVHNRIEMFECPAAGPLGNWHWHYGVNPWVSGWWHTRSEASVSDPSRFIYAADHATGDWPIYPWAFRDDPEHLYLTPRHQQRVTALFADGHVVLKEPQSLVPPDVAWDAVPQ